MSLQSLKNIGLSNTQLSEKPYSAYSNDVGKDTKKIVDCSCIAQIHW